MFLQAVPYILIVAAAVGVVLFFKYRSRWDEVKRALNGETRIPGHLCEFKYGYKTPGGVKVWSTKRVPADVLPVIDEGISNQITRHNRRYPEWMNGRELSDYKVLFVEPMTTNMDGSPAIFVGAYQIQSAGSVIGCHSRSACRPDTYLVAPHQEAQNWAFRDYLMRTMWHESEHDREYHNDLNVFLRYAVEDDVHPHVGDDGVTPGERSYCIPVVDARK